MRGINREENIHLQIDNVRIHWTLDALNFYKDNITLVCTKNDTCCKKMSSVAQKKTPIEYKKFSVFLFE